jgi:hypothetical protein
MNPQELLYEAAQIIDQRGQGYGGIENNFQLAADLATLRLGRNFHPYEIAIILACVKNARAFNTPTHMDSHVDAVNYELFAATFAEDYVLSNTARSEAVYKDKKDLKVARAAKLTVIDDKSSDSAVAGESA